MSPTVGRAASVVQTGDIGSAGSAGLDSLARRAAADGEHDGGGAPPAERAAGVERRRDRHGRRPGRPRGTLDRRWGFASNQLLVKVQYAFRY